MIPLADCIARPEDENGLFPLVAHSVAVAGGCGEADGPPASRLAFLAGLSHDLAKADAKWQHYIRNVQSVKDRPKHAPLGSALFAFWAAHLIELWVNERRGRERLHDEALDWTRVVYDHHSGLDDVTDDTPWERTISNPELTEQLARCDQAALSSLVQDIFPGAQPLTGFAEWLGKYGPTWKRRVHIIRPDLLRDVKRERPGVDVPLAVEGLRLARFAARLVYADRAHAAGWGPDELSAAEAARGLQTLAAYLDRRAAEAIRDGERKELVDQRRAVSDAALAAYAARPGEPAYTLLVPTGFGKTLAGLRVALAAVAAGRCRRVVYVAPYLSILSQAAGAIREASGVEVFVHHHLTAALLEEGQPIDVMETWQAPLVATTFNQFCRALFPARAQQCLRAPALDGAFVVIDEPQVFDAQAWPVLLRAVRVAADERKCQALLMTATLPPSADGLGLDPVPLVPDRPAPPGRYVIKVGAGAWDADRTAREARDKYGKVASVAVILNTVRDALDVYQRAAAGGGEWYFLAAAMLPGHKAARIRELRYRLRLNRPGGAVKTGVVCTQVLEAGVDLSFRALLRARPVFPSVAQAAGRANRHGEVDAPAEVIVFPFVRADGRDSREFVYRDETARGQTDRLLADRPELPEADVPAALDEYYRRCWEENRQTAGLGLFEVSARGAWSALAGLEPFADPVPRVDVFVPGSDCHLLPAMHRLLDEFGVYDSHELLDKYRDPAFRNRKADKGKSFRRKKRLAALVRQFVVAVPAAAATAFARPDDAVNWLWVLDDSTVYAAETGFAHLLGRDEPAGESIEII